MLGLFATPSIERRAQAGGLPEAGFDPKFAQLKRPSALLKAS
jgi:hypothetical protein